MLKIYRSTPQDDAPATTFPAPAPAAPTLGDGLRNAPDAPDGVLDAAVVPVTEHHAARHLRENVGRCEKSVGGDGVLDAGQSAPCHLSPEIK